MAPKREWRTIGTTVGFDPDEADGYMKHHLPLDQGVLGHLEDGERVRGEIAGTPFSRVISRTKGGQRCLKFGEGWLGDIGLAVGDDVTLLVDPEAAPDHVEVPDELAAALATNPEAEHRWEALTPGRRRTLAYDIGRAKRPETRTRRARSLVQDLASDA